MNYMVAVVFALLKTALHRSDGVSANPNLIRIATFRSPMGMKLSLCDWALKSKGLAAKRAPGLPRIISHGPCRHRVASVRCEKGGGESRAGGNPYPDGDRAIPIGRRETFLRGVGAFGLCGCSTCCGRNRGGWYDKYFAYALSHTMDAYEGLITPTKDKMFGELRSSGAKNILEVGVGYGPNARYYVGGSNEFQVTGLDPNPAMETYAITTAESVGLADFTFLQSYAENIPVKSGTYDAVVCTLVLCSVPDVIVVLKEIQRVVKPGGQFFFIEHVAAPQGTAAAFGQKLLNPLQGLLADGCHLDRDTLKSINEAGFGEVQAESFEIPELTLLSNHIWGVATV